MQNRHFSGDLATIGKSVFELFHYMLMLRKVRGVRNIKHVLKLCVILFEISKKLFVLTALQIIISSAQPIISVLFAARIVQMLIDQAGSQQIFYMAALLVLLNLICGLITAFLKSRTSILNAAVKDDFCLRAGQKIMKLPYERLEEPELLDLKEESLLPIIEWGNFEFILNDAIPVIVGSILTVVITLAIVAGHNLMLLLPIVVISILCMLISGFRQRVFDECLMKVGMIERKLGYYQGLTQDFTSGKDLRLFGIDNIIMKKIRKFNDTELHMFSKLLNSTTRFNVFETILMQGQFFIVYALVAYDVLNRGLSVGFFLETTGLFINMGLAVSALLETLATVTNRGRFLEGFFKFDNLPTDLETGSQEPDSISGDIILQDVSFGYKSTGIPILQDINFTISEGEKVAFVGENGSGKTTLVKLICGLLKPTKGKIMMGSNKIMTNNVSAVFQDFKLFAFSIKENIELSQSNKGNIIEILKSVGLLEDVQKLKKGVKTLLFKSFSDDGMELSGGQGQKLAIARAIYKNSSVVILDEPTASLDAKSEAEIFQQFQNITSGKTAILVSHRLSSCRFCDKIIVLDAGRIIEQGTHDELMEINNGKYKELFTAQAEYYN